MAPPALAPPAASTSVKAQNTLNAKYYIMAALMATLATAVVVTVVFIALSPARIYFSVTYAASEFVVFEEWTSEDGVMLILTLAANNTSRRARVEYQSLFVDVSNTSTWFRAGLTVDLPLHQPTRNVTTINATLYLGREWPWGDRAFFIGDKTSTFTVRVTTLARFKVGFAPTRLYDIKVSCRPVSFFPKGAGQSGAPTGLPPVKCG